MEYSSPWLVACYVLHSWGGASERDGTPPTGLYTVAVQKVKSTANYVPTSYCSTLCLTIRPTNVGISALNIIQCCHTVCWVTDRKDIWSCATNAERFSRPRNKWEKKNRWALANPGSLGKRPIGRIYTVSQKTSHLWLAIILTHTVWLW